MTFPGKQLLALSGLIIKILNDPTAIAGKQIVLATLMGLNQANKTKQKEENSPLNEKTGISYLR